MSKAKSVVITVVIALIMAVATFFAAVSFPVSNKVKRYNSFLSNIRLGAEYSGYVYTTVYPEGVISADEYNGLVEAYETSEKGEDDTDPSTAYTKVGGLYVENEEHSDIEALKKDVAADAEKLNKRIGEKGYSSYSVAVEDGVSIKVSVPTNFSAAAYENDDETYRSEAISTASTALSTLTAYGNFTFRTTDSSITTTDSDGNSKDLNMLTYGGSEWVDTALVDDSKTYSLSKEDDDVASWLKSVTSRTVGTNYVITFKFTKDGRTKFKELTTLVASSSSQTIYFFVGNTQILSFSSCTSAIDESSLSLTASSADSAQNSAITINSAISGGNLSLNYRDISSNTIFESVATGGDNAALFALIASLIVFVGLCVLLIKVYKRLGAVCSAMAYLLALVEVYALYLLNIQVTFPVIIMCVLLIALYVISCTIVFSEVKRLVAVGRTVQASVKDAYKHVIMSVADMHIVLVVAAIIAAAVGAGEVAACGLIAVVGVVASYVLYWFTRFMWYVCSSPVKDKFAFAGMKRVVYEDD